MGEEDRKRPPHVLVFPAPGQGHINPMFQFAQTLASHGLAVSLVITTYITKTMHAHTGKVNVQPISDGFDDAGWEASMSPEVYVGHFREVGSRSLLDLVLRLSSSNSPPTCIVYDSFLCWALDVAKRCGLVAASFFTQSCAVNLAFYNAYKQQILMESPEVRVQRTLSWPVLEFELCKLPSFLLQDKHWLAEFNLNQFSNLHEADWVLCNTFSELETQEMNCMTKFWPVKAIGPAVPASMYLSESNDEADHMKDYGLSLWKKEDVVWKKWLQEKEVGSVVYVSFGSLASLGVEQMEEIACALKECSHSFLWVVRASEENKLPNDFVETTREKGLTVKWASQLEILSHEAIGCFVTHCGWNSTLEGLTLGVPMAAVPQSSDQPTNAKYIEQVWKVGVRAMADDQSGVVGREELKRCIGTLMGAGRRREMLGSISKWKQLALHATNKGGSSDMAIREFVAAILQ